MDHDEPIDWDARERELNAPPLYRDTDGQMKPVEQLSHQGFIDNCSVKPSDETAPSLYGLPIDDYVGVRQAVAGCLQTVGATPAETLGILAASYIGPDPEDSHALKVDLCLPARLVGVQDVLREALVWP